MIRRASAALLLLLTAALAPAADPKAADPRLVVEPFAAAPDIVHPIAMDFDAKGRLLVIESHTHFRPANYAGPKHDRIRVLEDTDGDGKADKFTTFYEGTDATMDIAVHPDGSVYLATRNEIIRLRDRTGKGMADERISIVGLETKGNYPHNGLSGLSFDSRGNVFFGMGENLGADYALVGSDSKKLTGGGEGGSIFTCDPLGKGLRRVATGFWNPFGSCRDIYGRLFVVDNDPDASPPCKLVQVVEGGDYGFQFRYGRAGRHPFQAWNGELPGTLPFVAGTGESPCEVVSYESDGLPAEYLGSLLVPAWADHRVERYVPRPRGAGFVAERMPFVQGGSEFRPSGLTVAPDGSLFVSDWVSRSYELHGKGAVWHIRWKNAPPPERPTNPKVAILSSHAPLRAASARTLAKDAPDFLRPLLQSSDPRLQSAVATALVDAGSERFDAIGFARRGATPGLRAMAVRALTAQGADVSAYESDKNGGEVVAAAIVGLKGDAALPRLLSRLADPDPYLSQAAIHRLSQLPELLAQVKYRALTDPKQRVGILLAYRASSQKNDTAVIPDFLADPDPDVRFMAVKWVSDEKLTEFRPQIVEALKNPALDPRAFVGLTTALARLDNKPVNEDGLAGYFVERLADPAAPASTRILALRGIPAGNAKLRLDLLTGMLKNDDPAVRIEALRALKDRGDAKAIPAVLAIVTDAKQPAAVRVEALVALGDAAQANADFLTQLATGDADPALRREALRALVRVKLTDAQQSQLTTATKDRPDCTELVARIAGKPFTARRPSVTNTDAWLKFLDGPADPAAGRRVFENTKLAGCYRCHKVEGRGANVGPDLSLIGRTERRWIVESILQPSSVVAPHYQAWKIDTADGQSRTGLLVGTYLDVSEYVDEKGSKFKVAAGDVLQTTAARTSIMPDRLLDTLTDQEARDLVAYLAGRK
ncbi:PVC-type heme-binding CxxCH protein [Fimbriiglobus ruber]|uniref:Cytochrome c domain-containing protein n=1 Tax=Fimbriiglobus ruber TaxID=1908690 RepID=A0A225DHC4_9BACT|nr:PVC-type heme-binding CxxCH protein [Fimbriiglobus ruber]OWK37958.1 hypothetical protein FRUB_07078 [Fimbriiglobus ruber]